MVEALDRGTEIAAIRLGRGSDRQIFQEIAALRYPRRRKWRHHDNHDSVKMRVKVIPRSPVTRILLVTPLACSFAIPESQSARIDLLYTDAKDLWFCSISMIRTATRM